VAETGFFDSDSTVVLRLTGHYDTGDAANPHRAGLLQGWPYVVVEDGPDLVALYMPVGTEIAVADLRDRGREVSPLVHGEHPSLAFRRGEKLRLKNPGSRHSVWLHWSAAEERRFLGWYVNMEATWERTRIGFDTTDLALDLIVEPDRRWTLKDDAELDKLTRLGVFTDEERERIRSEAMWVISRIESGSAPFDESWLGWTPPVVGTAPRVPAEWDLVPGAAVTHFTGRSPGEVDPAYRTA
jgi:hypothetical protein